MLSRRHLFGLLGGAAVAPLLPAVAEVGHFDGVQALGTPGPMSLAPGDTLRFMWSADGWFLSKNDGEWVKAADASPLNESQSFTFDLPAAASETSWEVRGAA